MSEAPQYWSPEFIEVFVERMNEDSEFQRAARGFSETIILRCLDAPGDEDVEASYTFEEGTVVGVDLWIDDAPSEDMRNDPFDKSEGMARATADYETWCKLDRGEMGVMQALASPDYKIEGPKLRIMTNIGVLNGMSDVAAKIEKTY